jgi:hypothetical protein
MKIVWERKQIYNVLVFVLSVVNVQSFFHKNLVMIRRMIEEFHINYYEVDKHVQVNPDLIGQLLSKENQFY